MVLRIFGSVSWRKV
jgi:hypothetical protein